MNCTYMWSAVVYHVVMTLMDVEQYASSAAMYRTNREFTFLQGKSPAESNFSAGGVRRNVGEIRRNVFYRHVRSGGIPSAVRRNLPPWGPRSGGIADGVSIYEGTCGGIAIGGQE